MFKPAAKPPTPLGYHRILSPKAGARVSPLCLGAMNFGKAWAGMMGECDKETSFKIMDYFYESSGNFIDTANVYQNEESEVWMGEWMEQRGVRDQMFVATKYTSNYRSAQVGKEQMSAFVGNSAKSMHVSVRRSLEKLKTDYIDLLYVHWWDYTTGVEEVMRAAHSLVMQGKVLYLGASDTPAWVVVKANEYANQHGLTPFSVYQGKWNAGFRDLERDVIPMCQDQGMAIAPWGVLGQGNLRTKKEFDTPKEGGRQRGGPSETDKQVSAVLEEIADAKKSTIRSVALAWAMHKTPHVFPIVGGRKVEHLKENIDALSLALTREEIQRINKAVPFDPGFPNSMIFMGVNYDVDLDASDVLLARSAVHIDVPKKQQATGPHQDKPQDKEA